MMNRLKVLVLMLAGLLLPLSAGAVSIEGGNLVANGITYSDTGAEAVTLTDTDGNSDDATAFLFLELAGYEELNAFGIYGFQDDGMGGITLGETLEIFSGSDSAIDSVTLTFDLLAGTVTHSGTSDVKNIGKTFGFYIDNDYFFYSHTSLNQDGFDHFKIFDTNPGDGELFGSDVVLGIEDLYGGGDADYNDMVVGVTDVAPVPEPGTLLLLGSGLAGFAAARRRKKA